MRRLALALLLLLPTALPQRRDPSTGMQFVRIPAGDFLMGTPASEPMREAQEVQHRVRIARDFYLATHEVTEREWALVTGRQPSSAAGCAACPVERISYVDVQAFVARLNATSAWPGFRLPTEAEWEYACRAGAGNVYATGAAIDRHRANIDATRTLPVGSFPPNGWGLFDMSGNVWEWTSDDYAPYPGAIRPRTPAFTGEKKVIRGGSWRFAADSARCGLRYTHNPQDRGDSLGVRLAHN